MSDAEMRENTRALFELKTAMVVQTEQIKTQTEFIKEQFDNGFASLIVSKVTAVFYKTTGIFGFIATIMGLAIYFLMR